MEESYQIYELVCKNKNNWIELSGGISNKVYCYENKYVIKIINKSNDNLFLSLTNYYIVLEKLNTTIYLDKMNNIIIEKYIDGNIVSDKILFEIEFSTKVFDLIDNSLYTLNYPIEKNNIIIQYINQLSQYININNVFIEQVKKINNTVLVIIKKYIIDKTNNPSELYFSHNDIQKYNILISNEEKINLIDYEYSGYTWKYFDHSNFIVLLFNEAITNKFDEIKNSEPYIEKYFNLTIYQKIIMNKYLDIDLEYFYSMTIISAYTWYLWSLVKYDKTNDNIYIEYSKQMEIIINHIINKYNLFWTLSSN